MLIYQKMTWLKSGRVFFFLFYNFQYLSNYSEGQMHRVALKKKKLLASRLMLGLNLSRVSPELSVHNESMKPSIVNSSVSCLIRCMLTWCFRFQLSIALFTEWSLIPLSSLNVTEALVPALLDEISFFFGVLYNFNLCFKDLNTDNIWRRSALSAGSALVCLVFYS